MTATARATQPTSVLRTADGEPPLGIGGLAFRDDQGEMFAPSDSYRAAGLIGVLELQTGQWIAHPFTLSGKPLFDRREAALRFAIARMVRKARKYMRNGEGEGTHWTEGYAGRVIEWALSLKPEKILNHRASDDAVAPSGHPGSVVATKPYRISVQFSGGAASYVAAKLILEEFGHDGVALIFADTLIEDEDLYRFLKDAEDRLQHPIIKIFEGRDPWSVFFDERMMGNSRVDPCSKILKRKLLDKWRVANCTPDCTLVIGYDASEDFRFQPLKERMSPVKVRAPLLEQGIWKEQAYAMVEADGLRLPRLYQMGFPHNNCGGFCVKAGQASFALLLEQLPERYAAHEAKEEEFRTFIGKDVSIMRDRRGGVSKPLTMRAFRERHQADPTLLDRSDLGGCMCMEEPQPEPEEINPPVNPNNVLGVKREPEEITDPVVAELVAAHRLRKTYPAGHTFSMTNPIVNGHMVTLGTCSCGHSFSYSWGSYERMDAAIEAHWQKFDASPDKVDGRGQPIGAEAPPAKPKRARKRKEPGALEGIPAPLASASPGAPLDDADAVLSKAAPIGATSNEMVGGLPVTAAPYHAERTGPRASGSAAKSNAGLETGVTAGETAPISIAQTMAAEPADDWSPLLREAFDLAWCDQPRPKKPKGPQLLPDGRLVGPEEYAREVVKQRLKDAPPNPGPLFGAPPPSTTAS
jgi:hypothetical protein